MRAARASQCERRTSQRQRSDCRRCAHEQQADHRLHVRSKLFFVLPRLFIGSDTDSGHGRPRRQRTARCDRSLEKGAAAMALFHPGDFRCRGLHHWDGPHARSPQETQTASDGQSSCAGPREADSGLVCVLAAAEAIDGSIATAAKASPSCGGGRGANLWERKVRAWRDDYLVLCRLPRRDDSCHVQRGAAHGSARARGG